MRFELSESFRLAPATLAVTSITEVAGFVFVCEVLFEADVVCFETEVLGAVAVLVPFEVGIVEELALLVVVADIDFASVTHFSYILSSCFWVIQPGGHMPCNQL